MSDIPDEIKSLLKMLKAKGAQVVELGHGPDCDCDVKETKKPLFLMSAHPEIQALYEDMRDKRKAVKAKAKEIELQVKQQLMFLQKEDGDIHKYGWKTIEDKMKELGLYPPDYIEDSKRHNLEIDNGVMYHAVRGDS